MTDSNFKFLRTFESVCCNIIKRQPLLNEFFPRSQTERRMAGSSKNYEKSVPTATMELRNDGSNTAISQRKIHRSKISEQVDVLELDADLEFPDGGLKAYSVVVGCMLGFVSVFGVLNSIGAVQAYISENQLKSVSSSTVSWIFAIYMFFTFASCIFCGCYFDRNGCKLMMYVGTALSIVGIFCLAESKEVYQFILCLSLLFGTGSGILMTCFVSSVATWFKEKRAIANSIASLGGSFGGIVFPVMLRKLYTELGYTWAIRILAFIVTFCLLAALALNRENPLVMRYNTEKESWRKVMSIYMKNTLDLRFLLDFKFLFCTLGCCFAENGLMVVATYYPSYAISIGVPENTSYMLITIINCCGILGRVSGYIADRYVGRFMVLSVCLLFMTILSLVMWLPFGHSLKVLYAFSAVYGFVCSSILSLVPIAVGQICKIEEFGKRYSTMYFMTAVASLAFLPIAGAIIGNGSNKNYNNYIIYCSILTFAGAFSYTTSRLYAVGTKRIKF